MTLTIRRDFARPAATELQPFQDAPTGWVVDAIGRRGSLPHWIRPLTEAKRFVGTALTVHSRPIDNLAPYAALKFAKPGDVLVVATDGDEVASVLGDILLGMARNAGIVAAVTDGLVRDIAGLNAVDIPVFARALTPNSPFKNGPGSVGLPIALGNIAIESGDLLVGDADGVVVVPRSKIAAAASELAVISAKEASMDQAVAEGATYPAWLDDALSADTTTYVD